MILNLRRESMPLSDVSGVSGAAHFDPDAIFADARQAPDRRSPASAADEPQADRRTMRGERRGERLSRSRDCWWLKRNYVSI